MSKDDIEELAKLFSNTKTKKRALDLVEISKLVNSALEHYENKDALADKLGISREMVRQFTLPEKLPEEIKNLIKDRKIDSIEAVKLIYGIQGEDNKIKFAKAIVGLGANEIRDFKRLVTQSKMSFEDARRTVLKAKQERLHILVLLVDDKTYTGISSQANTEKSDEVNVAEKILSDWVEGRKVR